MTLIEQRKKEMKRWLLMKSNTWIKGKPAICVKILGKTYAAGFWFVEEIPF